MLKQQPEAPWYASESGVRIGRYTSDDAAAKAIALALDPDGAC
jgi:hypothetical protein